ncbi:MAG: hypothetical protein KAV42_10825 [Candidatus Krumholzibacteria bacterium]|nr:hypothetical protein [Candidatus Krumholzibacteria bacterium]
MKFREVTDMGISVCLIFCVLLSAGCGEPELQSTRLNREISIDGKDSEWGGLVLLHDVDTSTRISIMNDDRFIYACLSTRDPETQIRVIKNGFTVWFDKDGGKDCEFGINYPMKSFTENGPPGEMAGFGPPNGRDRNSISGNTPGSDRGIPPNIDPRMIRLFLQDIPGSLDIIRPESDIRLTRGITKASELGIDVSMDMRDGNLVLEMKIPLVGQEESVHSIGATPGSIIGIGFVAGRMEMQKNMRSPDEMDGGGMRPGGMGGGRGGGRPGGMGGGRGGGGRPGGKGRPGSGGPAMQKPLEIWVKLKLAESHEQ